MRRVVLVGCLGALVACGGSKGSAEELCAAVRADRSTAAVFDGFDPTDTVEALEQLRAARLTLGGLRDAAPDEVRDALDVEIAYVQALADTLEPMQDAEPAQVVEAVRQVTADHPGVKAAAGELAAFSDEHCT